MPLYWYQAVVGERIEIPDQVPHSYAQQMEMWKNYNGPFIVLDEIINWLFIKKDI